MKLQDKDDDDVSDGEIEEDVILFLNILDWLRDYSKTKIEIWCIS